MKKREVLRDLIRSEDVHTAIIFCNRKTTVRELNKSLQQHGFRSGEIHGDIDQSTRQKMLEAFKGGTINLLVASDVAARGLDIKGVSHVFNFDAPWHPDDYVHRIGRTGRAGAKGKAFTFVTKADEEAIDNIEKLIGGKIDRLGRIAAAPATEKEAKPERAAKAERSAKSERAPKPDRAPRQERVDAEVAAKPVKAAAPKPKAPAPKSSDSDDGWNGPMPSFLSFSVPN
jgi:superfamily II DNA/RNA helicase